MGKARQALALPAPPGRLLALLHRLARQRAQAQPSPRAVAQPQRVQAWQEQARQQAQPPRAVAQPQEWAQAWGLLPQVQAQPPEQAARPALHQWARAQPGPGQWEQSWDQEQLQTCAEFLSVCMKLRLYCTPFQADG